MRDLWKRATAWQIVQTASLLAVACGMLQPVATAAPPDRAEASSPIVEASVDELELSAVPRGWPIERDDRLVRTIHLVFHRRGERHPVAGRLTVLAGEARIDRRLSENDFVAGTYLFDVPEPQDDADRTVSIDFQTDRQRLQTKVAIPQPPEVPWREYVQRCLDTLLEHGRDDYGAVKSPLFMAVLDADTRRSPRDPYPLDALVRLEGRMHRRGERGSNLWYDQALLKACYRMAELTGEDKYASAADDYIRHFLTHCRKQVDEDRVYLNGMPAWGTHVFWDCFDDRPAGDGDGDGPHEILVFRADWKNMYRVAPDEVKAIADGIWTHHVVDKQTGLHNRHDDGSQGCDFAFSGSSFAHAFASMYQATGRTQFLHQAKTVARWHWDNRNRNTGLTADCPGLTRRYDGNHCFTTVSGPHAMALLECYALTGDAFFRDAAYTYIKSYDRYGWDPAANTYWAMLTLDGKPLADRPKGSGYDAYAPYGHVNVWRTTFYSYEFSLSAAQAAVQACETSLADGQADSELLQIAQRWAGVIENAIPAHTGRRWKAELEAAMPWAAETGGAYAEDYGRAISLMVHMYRIAGEPRYLQLAERLAGDAVRRLFHNDIFVGHPAKPYYETTNGVGLLLVALLELDAPGVDLGGAY